jgi:hypothetical protein
VWCLLKYAVMVAGNEDGKGEITKPWQEVALKETNLFRKPRIGSDISRYDGQVTRHNFWQSSVNVRVASDFHYEVLRPR